ncbi:NAD(P)-dependent oxidoreductase [Pelagibacteraceae bacterium]|nr:NAD(P)-dependent oxidoreductase [Pelagibacteraceae bacterium]
MNISEKQLSKKKVFITGSGGYIGSELVTFLIQHNCKVFLLSRKKNKKYIENGITFLPVNIKKSFDWLKIVKSVDVIIHLAWNNSIEYAELNSQKSLIESTTPVLKMIEASKIAKKKIKFIFSSTATLYGVSNNDINYNEKLSPNPFTNYDINKLSVENLLKKADNEGLITAISLRLSNVYGPSKSKKISSERGVINKMIKSAIEQDKIYLYDGGNYFRDFIFINDVITSIAYAIIAKNLRSTVFNIGYGKSYTFKDFFKVVALKINQKTGKKIIIKHRKWPKKSHIIGKRNFKCSNLLFRSATGWKPKISIQSGIIETVNSYLKYN